MYRADDEMLTNTHVYGIGAYTAPALRLSGIYTAPGHVMQYDDGEIRQQFSICFRARPGGGGTPQVQREDAGPMVAPIGPLEVGRPPHDVSPDRACNGPDPPRSVHRLTPRGGAPFEHTRRAGEDFRFGTTNERTDQAVRRVATGDLR
jgi:hypothetical protein